jgi:hypothetical protein
MATTALDGVQSQRRPSPLRGRDTNPRTPGGRRNRPALVLGVLLVVLCGGASAALYSSAGHRSKVLAVRNEVAPGSRINDADLGVVEVGADSSLRLVAASARARVVGRIARVGLVPGSLVIPDQLARADAVPAGQSVVALLLHFGQAPTLAPGDQVRVVAPEQQLDASAQVFAVEHQREGSNDVRVSVLADDATAARIASVVASQGQITVVRRSAGP